VAEQQLMFHWSTGNAGVGKVGESFPGGRTAAGALFITNQLVVDQLMVMPGPLGDVFRRRAVTGTTLTAGSGV
jgi:hypothetical protein